jgi:hypothetical protein
MGEIGLCKQDKKSIWFEIKPEHERKAARPHCERVCFLCFFVRIFLLPANVFLCVGSC